MRKIITYFIKFPVAVNIFILTFFVFGIAGALSMKSSFFPLTESQNISISVTYPGASPQEMEEGIVLRIEDNLKGLVGIDRVTSVSRENSASINIEVVKGKDIDVVVSRIGYGVPVGLNLEYADDLTLSKADLCKKGFSVIQALIIKEFLYI